MTISFLGTADKESAPVDETMVFSSICKKTQKKRKTEFEIEFCF
jgi:hypothetical protein